MPVYTYRREDGTTFEIRQSFNDEPLTVCPTTGQKVARIVQPAGIIFKGPGFYVTDNGRSSSRNGGNGAKDHKETSGTGSGESGNGKKEFSAAAD